MTTPWFSSTATSIADGAAPRYKVARDDISQAFAQAGNPAPYTDLRGHIMQLTECPNAQAAITEACQQGWVIQSDGQYRLPLYAGRHRLSARGSARADAQGRCDGAGSQKIGSTLPRSATAAGGFLFFGTE
jgi:hypothetical protein